MGTGQAKPSPCQQGTEKQEKIHLHTQRVTALLRINNPSQISCWSFSTCLPMSRISVKTLIDCRKRQQPLDIPSLSLFPFLSFFLSLPLIQILLISKQLQAGYRQGKEGTPRGKLICTSNGLHHSDVVLFH